MKEYDFLFLYEVKNRELENICLLKYELERRGYTVKFLETWRLLVHPRLFRLKAKVVVCFSFYGDGQANMCCEYVKNIKKIVNMQWEQVYSIGDEEDEETLYHLKGAALRVSHFSWGNYNYRKLIDKFGIPEKQVALVGHLSFDFFKPYFKGYYLSKEELCKKYNLPLDKKIFLFISSFSVIGMPASLLFGTVNDTGATPISETLAVSIKSQTVLLSWIKDVMPKYQDTIFIYRPHPAEGGNTDLTDLEKSISNFRVIGDETIKQWIIVSDKIYSWYSTSVGEAYAAHKPISVIRPVELPKNMDFRLYYGCNSIKNKEEFEESLTSDTSISLDDKMMNLYYSFFEDYTYEKICNKLEEVLNDDSYMFDFEKEYYIARPAIKRLISIIARWIWNPLAEFCKKYPKIGRKIPKGKRFKKYYGEYEYVSKMARNNYSSQKEINAIVSHIKNVIEKNKAK